MTNDYLPYSRQFIDSHDIKAVSDVLKSDFLTTGPVVEAFEDALSDQFNGASVMVCSSGTAALHLAALSLELDINYWAIVPAITFVATANAIRYTGGNVIFCDVDPNSGLMIVFPGWVTHSVPPQEKDKERIVIAGNISVDRPQATSV